MSLNEVIVKPSYCGTGQSIVRPNRIIKQTPITEAEMNGLTVPEDEIWFVTLDDGTQWQNDGGDGWVQDTSGGGGVGLQGPKGDDGEKGDPFVYSDFTQPQLDALKGEKGDPFVYSDFTTQQLDNLKGEKGDTGEQGPQGEEGPAGTDGEDGKSTYQIAVDNGFVGTEQEWLDSTMPGETVSEHPNSENPNPELIIDKGALSFGENEFDDIFDYEGFAPLNNASITSVYDPSNGFGDYVIDVQGNGADINPALRVKLNTEDNADYDLDVRIKYISGTGKVSTTNGTDTPIDQTFTNTEWETFSFEVDDDASYSLGIILLVQGFQNNSNFRLKISLKERL